MDQPLQLHSGPRGRAGLEADPAYVGFRLLLCDVFTGVGVIGCHRSTSSVHLLGIIRSEDMSHGAVESVGRRGARCSYVMVNEHTGQAFESGRSFPAAELSLLRVSHTRVIHVIRIIRAVIGSGSPPVRPRLGLSSPQGDAPAVINSRPATLPVVEITGPVPGRSPGTGPARRSSKPPDARSATGVPLVTVVGPFGLSVWDETLDADMQAGLAAVEEGLLEATKSDVLHHRRRQAPSPGRRQALPATAGDARGTVRRPARAGRRARRRRGRTDPPRHALPRRRHGRGRRAPGDVERQRPLGQLGGRAHR